MPFCPGARFAPLDHRQELEARLPRDKDSHNSSKPPSSDPLGRKRPRSQRRKSGKKPGGQLGHRGETLHLVATPDEVVEHRPAVCAGCQTPLDETASVVLYERRQVRDLPPVRLLVREHRALHVRCPQCEQVSVGPFPAEASSRAQYGPRLRALAVYLLEQQLIPYARVRELFADLLGAPVSVGTLHALGAAGRGDAAAGRGGDQGGARARAGAAQRRDGRASGGHAGVGACGEHEPADPLRHPRQARAARRPTPSASCPRFTGVSVHDGWKPYRRYTQLPPCAVQHPPSARADLPGGGVSASLGQGAQGAAAGDEGRRRAGAHCAGTSAWRDAERSAFVTRYEALLAAGLAANPPPAATRRDSAGRVKQSARAQSARTALASGSEEVLAFLDDFTIPFDNNQAEQDLRMLKVQQKIAGLLPRGQRLRSVRPHQRLSLLDAQAGRGAPGRPADRLHWPAALSRL